jgi:hypothetical protein
VIDRMSFNFQIHTLSTGKIFAISLHLNSQWMHG